MLQLLLEGGQGYEDIGSLLGISSDEVRSRARSALTEIGGADPDAQVGLSDYLLGQADPIGRADAVRQLQADPDANALAQRLEQNLRLLAPKAQLPEIPEPRGGRRAVPPPPPPPPAAATPGAPPPAPPAAPVAFQEPGFASRAAGFFSGLGSVEGKRRTQLIVGVAAALALVIVIIVVATGGGSSGSNCAPLSTAAAQQAGVPTIKLTATGPSANAGCAPSGLITLGRGQPPSNARNSTPTFVLQANAVHMPQTGTGERYLLWLYKSATQSLPLGQETVDASGNLTGGVPLLAQQVLLLPAFDQVRFTKVTAAQATELQQSLQSQGKKTTGVTNFVGTPVLQGNISELGLNQLLQQAQQQSGTGGTSTTKR